MLLTIVVAVETEILIITLWMELNSKFSRLDILLTKTVKIIDVKDHPRETS